MNNCFFFKGRFTNDKHTKILVYDFYDQEKKSTKSRNLRNETHPGKNFNVVRGILRS